MTSVKQVVIVTLLHPSPIISNPHNFDKLIDHSNSENQELACTNKCNSQQQPLSSSSLDSPNLKRNKVKLSRLKIAVRASFRNSESCPPIVIQCRILQQEIQQKTIREKIEKSKIKQASCNETKNIAKNYGKAIISFIQKNKRLFRTICKETSTPYQRITQQMSELKSILTTVVGFRKIWTTYKYSECMRVISHIFLRRNALSYIFNSKVSNIQTHIKYRSKFMQALTDPQNFDHIKDY